MSLDIIIAKVLDDSRAEADRILAEHRRKAEELVRDETRKAEASAEAVRREAAEEAALEAGRIVTQARLERRIGLLSARKEIVDSVLEKALAGLPARHRALSKTIVTRGGETNEPFDRADLLDDVRPGLENAIAEILKI